MRPVTPLSSRADCTPGTDDAACIAQHKPLSGIPQTLLIPLAVRAHGKRHFPWLDCHDATAAGLLTRLEADTADLLSEPATVLNILWRTRVIQQAAGTFFEDHPTSTGVNLGCGLSNHFQWLNNGHNRWVDADLEEVYLLRQYLLPDDAPRRRNRVLDLREPEWWNTLDLPSGSDGTPVFTLCEGVLMYLTPEQVHSVLAEFAAHAPPGSRLLFDAIHHMGVGHASAHPNVGPTGAEFRWGIHHLDEVPDAHPRLRLLESRSVSECYGLGGLCTEAWLLPWLGAPLYSMIELGVD